MGERRATEVHQVFHADLQVPIGCSYSPDVVQHMVVGEGDPHVLRGHEPRTLRIILATGDRK